MKKTALVTGASSGIGYELVIILAQNCYDVILVARSKQKLEDFKITLIEKYNVDVTIIIKDLSRAEGANELFEEIKDKQIDVLINNAGIGDHGYFTSCNIDKLNHMMNLNILALTNLTRLILPSMIERNSGKIMNVSSIAGFQPGPLMAVYYASKAYVLSLSVALSSELSHTKVTVTVLCPGPTDTDFAKTANLDNSKLFQNLPVADVRTVSLYGYKKMQKGKTIAIPGLLNKLTVFMTKLTPRKLSANIVKKIQSFRTIEK